MITNYTIRTCREVRRLYLPVLKEVDSKSTGLCPQGFGVLLFSLFKDDRQEPPEVPRCFLPCLFVYCYYYYLIAFIVLRITVGFLFCFCAANNPFAMLPFLFPSSEMLGCTVWRCFARTHVYRSYVENLRCTVVAIFFASGCTVFCAVNNQNNLRIAADHPLTFARTDRTARISTSHCSKRKQYISHTVT